MESNHLFRSGILFQKYVIDMYSKALVQNLNYMRFNQDKMRAACYQDVIDAQNTLGADGQPGKHIILPSSFPGSDRHMRQLNLDFMAIVREYYNPAFFVTMTANPNWPEIKTEIDRQPAANRFDITNRVFSKKLEALIEDLFTHNVLGIAVAKLYVIEFQKRGLPHAHILIFLDRNSNPKSPEAVNRVVTSEVPDPVLNKALHDLVKRHMIHTVCDPQHAAYNPDESHRCHNKYGECCKKFPYALNEETYIPSNKYAQTKRTGKAQGGFVFNWKKKDGTEAEIDASWVVRYNPKLLLKYN